MRLPGGPCSEDDEELLVGEVEGQGQPSQSQQGGEPGLRSGGGHQLSRHSVETNQKQPLSQPSGKKDQTKTELFLVRPEETNDRSHSETPRQWERK